MSEFDCRCRHFMQHCFASLIDRSVDGSSMCGGSARLKVPGCRHPHHLLRLIPKKRIN
jgi:hypothetical protein